MYICLVYKKFENSWMLITLINVLFNSELQLDSVQYYPHIVKYCLILVKLGWYCQILWDIAWCWKESFRYFQILTFKKNVYKLMMPLIIFKYFVLMSVKSSCFCITVLGAKAPPELTHGKNRWNNPNISKSSYIVKFQELQFIPK